MGRKDQLSAILVAVGGLGGLAIITALTLAQDQPYRSALLFFGIAACVIGFGGALTTYFWRDQRIYRDPDGIYQRGQKVGTVTEASCVPSQGIVRFGGLEGGNDFNPNEQFEYRNYLLELSETPIFGRSKFPGTGWMTTISKAVCRIVSRTS
jgi:hypothetical protein